MLIYLDSDLELVSDPQKLICLALNSPTGIVPFILPRACCVERQWTKRDAILLTELHSKPDVDRRASAGARATDSTEHHLDSRAAADTTQHNANIWLFRKTKQSLAFVREWLELVQDPRAVTDDRSTLGPDFEAFQEHRHDQSVASLLVKKWGLKAYTPPDEFSRTYADAHYSNHLAPESGLGNQAFSVSGSTVIFPLL